MRERDKRDQCNYSFTQFREAPCTRVFASGAVDIKAICVDSVAVAMPSHIQGPMIISPAWALESVERDKLDQA